MSTVYRERPPVVWSVLCGSAYVALVGWMGWTADFPQDLGIWIALSLVFLAFLVGALLLPASRFLHFQIRLTPETLRVGRERIPVQELNPESVARARQEAGLGDLEVAARYGVPIARVPADEPAASGQAGPRLLGGGRGTPVGRRTVYLSTRGGEDFFVATRRPEVFLRALASVVGP